jgi:hypothetical protein
VLAVTESGQPHIRPTLRELARVSPAPIRAALAMIWSTARLERPAPVARLKHRWQSRNPRTYDEKVRFKMARDRRPLLTVFADKLAAREYVAEHAGENLLLELHDRSSTAEGIRWGLLPEEYVVKVNHGSGGLILVSRSADRQARLPRPEDRPGWSRHHIHPENAHPLQLAALCDYWLTLTYGWNPGRYSEWAYRDVTPTVFVEEYAGGTAGFARTVKVHCFNGVPVTFTVTSFDAAHGEESVGRFQAHQLTDAAEATGLSPDDLTALLESCRALSSETDFVRVDWLITPSGIRFGELTNYPAAGVGAPLGVTTRTEVDVNDLFFAAWNLPRRYSCSLLKARRSA